uniref:C3H1-type domain-containing protein n=1 Tax=Parascaris univalens TaxID=6257 RepID=A0A915CAT1_PARUN
MKRSRHHIHQKGYCQHSSMHLTQHPPRNLFGHTVFSMVVLPIPSR